MEQALLDAEVDLGPCTETHTMDKILNMREAQRELADRGRTTVIMRLTEHTRPYATSEPNSRSKHRRRPQQEGTRAPGRPSSRSTVVSSPGAVELLPATGTGRHPQAPVERDGRTEPRSLSPIADGLPSHSKTTGGASCG
ncbi:hypothetical protein [Streptomyces sp. NRRL F-525]|uniref:hypothetical protein n=1 Tax=Streptomyces sp. NRRL F-525 TaxID=1463861 RepID=UPI0005277C74|nr:hypothetical protein [Streptomyces sp. NRRL F-525]